MIWNKTCYTFFIEQTSEHTLSNNVQEALPQQAYNRKDFCCTIHNKPSVIEIFSVAVMSCGSDKKIYLGELQAWFEN